MKTKCEKCGKELKKDSGAFICSYECTFCADSSKEIKHICPNCRGELVKRPKKINIRG
jgi:uncharacterized protein